MLKEFRDFIMTGNVIDFAVAVLMAGAVGMVVNGFVTDIIMPVVGEFTGGMDFADLKHVLSPAVGVEGEAGYKAENAILYGKWINSIINLFTVGLVLFLIVKAYNKTKTPPPPPEEPAPAGPTDNELLAEIRDLLKKQ